MQLSKRLSAVAGLVTRGNRLVDVGCDHGYLPVYLYLNHMIPSAIAMDVRPGPLSRAEEHIAQYGLGEYIETRLSDGLAALGTDEGDTLVIAGMGVTTDGADSHRRQNCTGKFSGDDTSATVGYPPFSEISEDGRLEDPRGKNYPGRWKVLSYDESSSWRKREFPAWYTLHVVRMVWRNAPGASGSCS